MSADLDAIAREAFSEIYGLFSEGLNEDSRADARAAIRQACEQAIAQDRKTRIENYLSERHSAPENKNMSNPYYPDDCPSPEHDPVPAALRSGDLFGDSEPEDCIAQAIYLLQLCQQDLNMGRKSTVWPRAKRAREACQALESMFSPNVKDQPREL